MRALESWILVVSLAGATAVAACASGSSSGGAPVPGRPAGVVRSWQLESDMETAWTASLDALRDLGFEVANADGTSRRIVSEWRRFSTEAGSDACGSQYWGRVQLSLAQGASAVRLTVDPTFQTGAQPGEAGARTCPSNGRVERSLSRLVIDRTGRP